ncbi:UNVERIFIED_CONTAM: hypothetical protein HHA_454990 [Hammondia hammondi]|eukprot:XP_008888718.1 hypothetical protein HHA_454990 [Hammondia hammondi]
MAALPGSGFGPSDSSVEICMVRVLANCTVPVSSSRTSGAFQRPGIATIQREKTLAPGGFLYTRGEITLRSPSASPPLRDKRRQHFCVSEGDSILAFPPHPPVSSSWTSAIFFAADL